MTDVIKVKALSKSFGNFKAVNDLNLSVKQGEIFGFLGANGSGKTTTIRMLCGLLSPTSGQGRCFDLDLLRDIQIIKRLVGYMPQHFSYYPTLTVAENLGFVAGLQGLSPTTVVPDIMDRFQLTARKNQASGTLSGGWKQRLSLAACLMHQPKLLLLDEPTAGVDPDSRRYFWDTISELAEEGITVLVSTHYMDEAERCTYLGFMHQGHLVTHGSANQLLQQAKLEAFVIEADQLLALARKLEQLFPEAMTIRFGRHLHLVVKQGFAIQSMVNSLESLAYRLSWRPTELTIEHLFIRLIKQGGL